jgi:ATP-GRASP peptide maturase of grasp-with-spasm system
MVFIQSDSNDASTNDVLDWIYYLSGNTPDVVRVNDTHNIKAITIHITNDIASVALKAEGAEVNTDVIQSYWYRRGRLTMKQQAFAKDGKEALALSLNTRRYLDNEMGFVYEYLENSLAGCIRGLNRPKDDQTNKLSNLQLAAGLGLAIPESIVTNEFAALQNFAGKHKQIITKTLASNAFGCSFELGIMVRIGMGTILLNEEDIKAHGVMWHKTDLPLPAFYQQYIEKRLELRIFCLGNTFYTMAIFSQANEHTRIDFRNYDPERPNRCVPYTLPEIVSVKLKAFMKSAGMQSGSIDMILTPEGEYVFLEVNAIGQFQWLNNNCNYDINKKIAEFLIN